MNENQVLLNCRDCGHEVSSQAPICPECGAPYPYKDTWDGYGYEYKSSLTLFGLPLLHIAFKYRPNMMPVVARGIFAIGQFGFGIVNISQFGVGIFSLSQFTLAWFAIAQMTIAGYAICQMGIVIDGFGQQLLHLEELLK